MAKAREANSGAKESRAGIIEKATTPLGFLSLTALIVEAILLVIAAKSEGTNQTLIIVGVLLLLASQAGIVSLVFLRQNSSVNNAAQIESANAESTRLRNEICELQSALELARIEVEKHTAMRFQVLSAFDGERAKDFDDVISLLRISGDVQRANVRSVIGYLLQEGVIQESFPKGWVRVKEAAKPPL